MQLQIANDLTVNGISYNAIRMIEMQSSRNMPIDQLKVEFANKYYDNNTFSVGDSVVWTGGYTKEAQTEFTGEITEIKSFHPLTIMAKDNMIKLKRKLCSRNYSNIPIASFFSDVLPSGISAEIDSGIESDTISCYCNDKTVVWALKDLKARYNIDSFFKKGNLIVQNADLIEPSGDEIEFDTNSNVLMSDVKLIPEKSAKLTLKSFDPESGKVNKTTLGDGDEEVLMTLDGIRPDKLADKIKSIFSSLTNAKISGNFKAIGIPSAHHSEFIKYIDNGAGMEGTAFVDRVVKTFFASESIFEQRIFLR